MSTEAALGANVSVVAPPSVAPGFPAGAGLDLVRMRKERFGRICDQLIAHNLAAAVLSGTSALEYAAGLPSQSVDTSHAQLYRTVVVVAPGQAWPFVFTPASELLPPDLPESQRRPPLDLETSRGADRAVAALGEVLADADAAGGAVGFDHLTPALHRAWSTTARTTLEDVTPALAAAKVVKTADELECIQRAQRINEDAAATVRRSLRPGLRQTDLSALFLRQIFELGATGNGVDPIWQVMPARRADGPWTVHGDVAFPLVTTDRILREGDLLWVDTGITYAGYASDFGATWTVGPPRSRTLDHARRWQAVVDRVLETVRPGATGADLTAAAVAETGGHRPWLPHFYLVHGVGTDSAEMPMIGTDLGAEFDASLVLAPGMVLVLEPVVWEDGHAGYRAEQVVSVTDDGWTPLGRYPQDRPAAGDG